MSVSERGHAQGRSDAEGRPICTSMEALMSAASWVPTPAHCGRSSGSLSECCAVAELGL